MADNISLNDSVLVKYHLGLIMEQNLGHITHTQNLAQYLRRDASVQTTWILVPFQADDVWQKLPGYAMRLGLRTRKLVHAALREGLPDCLFYHTQVTALFSLGIMQRIPTVISLDATPTNFKTIGATYGYKVSTGILDRLKLAWYRRMFRSAAALITWSDWAKGSLVQDYGIAPDKVTVIRPGVELSQWCLTVKEARETREDSALRLLFIGGDFVRKGGYVLLEAFQTGLAGCCTLDIVTKDETVHSEGPIRVHRGLAPNSSQLRQMYADADLFVFPTLGDVSPIAVIEAMASGLPVVATDVGALAEEVEDGVTGLLVPKSNPQAIVEAVCSLANNPDRLAAMGVAARERAERLFDAEHNYKALVEVMKRCVDERRER